MTQQQEPGTSPDEPAVSAGGDAAAGRLLRSSAVVGLGTGLSRLTGFVRVGALAYALGATFLSDAYNLANTTPNIVYELILGGVLTATLVPIFVDHVETGDDDATSSVVTVAAVALVTLTVAAVLAAPWIARLYTLRLEPDAAAAQEAVAIPLMRLFLPQILFYGFTAIGTALLNARRAFAVPAFAPVLNNIVVSAMLLALPEVTDGRPTLDQVRGDPGLLLLLGLGTTAGIAAMTVVLLPALKRARVRLRWRFDWRHPAVRAVARLSGWTVGYAISNQIALFVVLALANRADRAGDVSAYQYAFVFFQLPHGLFAVSIMTTFVPDLARFAGRGDRVGFRDRFSLGLRLLMLVVLPAAAGYVLLARPLVASLLQRGAFSPGSAALTGDVLAAFALGLFGFSIYLYALRGFYALRDTKTPFVLNVVENGLNIVFAIALVGPLGVQGLALGYSAAYTVTAVLALVVLHRRMGAVDVRGVLRSAARIVVAVAALVVVVAVVRELVGTDTGGGAITRTAAGVLSGAVVYAVALVALRAGEVEALRTRLLRRPTSRPSA